MSTLHVAKASSSKSSDAGAAKRRAAACSAKWGKKVREEAERGATIMGGGQLRVSKALIITDKFGNSIDFTKSKSTSASSPSASPKTAVVAGDVVYSKDSGDGAPSGKESKPEAPLQSISSDVFVNNSPGETVNAENYPDDNLAIPTPLVRSANRWMRSKDDSVMTKIEKQVKCRLNKMTYQKMRYELSTQMCNIPLQSNSVLKLVTTLVYEKAVSEPSFSDMYAYLFFRLSLLKTKVTFIKIIKSDEDQSAEALGVEVDCTKGGSGSVSYRWSNDVSTSDAEIVGPFENEQQSIDAALADENTTPVKRGELELTLHRLLIRRGSFIKIMHSQADDKYYIVFFPIAQAHECGQQLSLEIFTSEIEAQNHAIKMNTFKRSLLNKCEDEFNQQDIYTDWKVEKKEYEKNKASFTEKERAEKAEELEFRRMKIKKQMLGNIKFSKCLVQILYCPSPSHILTFLCFQLVNCTSSACSKKRL